jgi:predicted acetyltransferase
MDVTIRPITDDEVPLFRRKLIAAFGGDARPEDDEHLQAIMPLDRTLAAFDGADIVGTFGDFPFDLTVPGGALAMAGTTVVTVQPTHRRRGILRAMMQRHLEDAHERGDPLAGLWASESSIYGRFGYGNAVDRHSYEIPARLAAFARPPRGRGTVRLVDKEEAEKVLPDVYARAQRLRPGMLSRSGPWWEQRWFRDPEHRREGKSSLRFALYEDPTGDVTGYLTYRTKGNWEDGHGAGTLDVEELVGNDESLEALWHFALNVDLMTKVVAWNRPLDDPLPWLLTDPRRVKRVQRDSLWVRPVDVAAALEGRRYADDGEVTLMVADGVCPWNDATYRLAVEEGRAEVSRVTTDLPDVVLDAAALGAVYLGGVSPRTLETAGVISGNPAGVATMARMFAWWPAPWCPEVF